MIVDLMRNDLSRVCEPGTVTTRGFLRVETHPHVHQLVSTVAGRLAQGCDVFDVIEASFPGGSMTGAPKRRAVELLAALEDGPRGLYSGCFGWIGHGGDAELAMTIRSVELRDFASPCGTATVGAGGGITADSDPFAEEQERVLKAAPLLALLAP
jgi:anthranilate synthase component 1